MINNHNPISFIISILLAFVSSVLTNSIYYLFISFMEKLFYKEENNKKITTPTIILLSVSFVFLLLYIIFNLKYQIIINDGFVGNQTSQIANLASSLKSITEFLRFFSVLGLVFLVADLFKNENKLMNKNAILVLSFIIFITYEIFWGRIQSGFNVAIHDLSNKIAMGEDSMDFYINTISNIQTTQLIIKSLFYSLLSLFILITNNKTMKNNVGLRFIFIIWIVVYMLIPIAYFIQNETMILISSYVIVGILTLALMLFIFVSFVRRSNKINFND